MKRSSPGFSLMELLIALSLSSFIMVVMVQAYRNVGKFINNAHQMMVNDRKICFFFNQIERDFTSVVMQEPAAAAKKKANDPTQPEDPAQKKPDDATKKPDSAQKLQAPDDNNDDDSFDDKDSKKSSGTNEKKKKNQYFLAAVDDAHDFKTVGATPTQKKHKLFKSVNFVTTNALQVYNDRRTRLVRVQYELEKDKEASKRDILVYRLIRKETTQLQNKKFQEKEKPVRKGAAPSPDSIRRHVIIDNVKEFSLEYVMPKPEKEDGAHKPIFRGNEEDKLIHSFEWGTEKELVGVVPQQVKIYITLWNEAHDNFYPFECMIPILTFWPDQDKEKEQKEKDAAKDKDGAKNDPKNPTNTQQNPTTPGPTQNSTTTQPTAGNGAGPTLQPLLPV